MVYYHLESFICIFTIIILCNCIISQPFIRTGYYFHYSVNQIKLLFGNPSYQSYLIVDLASNQTWLCPFQQTLYTSKTYQTITSNNITIFYMNHTYFGKEIIDNIIFDLEGIELKSFPFILINDYTELPSGMSNGVLGLSYTFSDEKQSIVHQMKHQGLIESHSFSIVHEHEIYFGGIPFEETVDKFHSSCKVRKGKGWNCYISHVIIRNNTDVFKHKLKKQRIATFTTNKEAIYVPKSFYDILISEYYQKGIDEKYYRLTKRNDRIQLYSSDDGNVIYGNITFVISGYAYTIDIDSFWDCYEVACDLMIYENTENDDWILGILFYKRFNVLFNYDEKRIHFYSNKGVTSYNHYQEEQEKKNWGYRVVFLLFNSSILLIGLGLIIIIKQNKIKAYLIE